MTFSATDAAFEGFRVVRRKPMVLVWWTAAYLAFMALIVLIGIGPIVSLMGAAEALEGVVSPTPEDIAPFMAAWGSLMVLLMPLGLLFGAVLNAAVARSVLEPGKSSFGYLRVGADELRVLAVTVALAVLAMFAFGGMGLAVGVIAGIAAVALGDAGWVVALLAGLGFAVLIAWLAARFSLAVPITMAERKIAVFDSWRVTKGKTLPIIGMAILAFIMTIVVSLLFSFVLFPITIAMGMAGGWEQLAQLEGATPAEIFAAMGPFLAVTVLFQAIGAALQLAVAYAPFSAAYLGIRGASPAAE
ncbi:MAG TPA: hypothetical protein VGR32_10800 [Brevundimonas sp.]|jgi:hypothetical protein|uniref:hypothetical protein n=1 Tax=Brevundimonas sp. TaxID=1871086 RepID=UPI002DF38080|nr:hypothetical protein [Brevundimonas sp.]